MRDFVLFGSQITFFDKSYLLIFQIFPGYTQNISNFFELMCAIPSCFCTNVYANMLTVNFDLGSTSKRILTSSNLTKEFTSIINFQNYEKSRLT